ncbi:YrhB domain-containing protein [Streptomyces sp. NPDC026665]|uniref:YrhB domain-containing protein n=1 Tax=Streptomyces sp. NPDC026665 TaxID=3154798 RepID=UPI0033FBD05A
MVSRGFAVRLVGAQLGRDERGALAVYGRAVRAAVSGVTEHELVWIVAWQSEEFLRTGDSRHALVGTGPYLVDKEDGSLHRIALVDAVTGAWEDNYRTRVKGQHIPGPVDELHDELRTVAGTRGRIHALRLLRRHVPAFGIGDAAAYVDALQGDLEPPAALLAQVAEALPLDTPSAAFGVTPVTGPNSPTDEPFPVPTLPGVPPHRRGRTARRYGRRLLGTFREVSAEYEDAPSIHEFTAPEPRPHEAELIAYLRGASVLTESASMDYDVLLGDGTTIGDVAVQSDGTWFWYSGLAHYVETYHLALDERFLAHAAARAWNPPRLGLAELLRLEEGHFDETGSGSGGYEPSACTAYT